MKLFKWIYAIAVLAVKVTTTVLIIRMTGQLFGLWGPSLTIVKSLSVPAHIGLPWDKLFILPLDALATMLLYFAGFGSRKLNKPAVYLMFCGAVVVVCGIIGVFATIFSLSMFFLRVIIIQGCLFLYSLIAIFFLVFLLKSFLVKSEEQSGTLPSKNPGKTGSRT